MAYTYVLVLGYDKHVHDLFFPITTDGHIERLDLSQSSLVQVDGLLLQGDQSNDLNIAVKVFCCAPKSSRIRPRSTWPSTLPLLAISI